MKMIAVAAVLVALGVLGVGADPIRAERVVRVPSVADQCPQAASWEKLKPCLQRFGDVAIEKQMPAARLVRVGSPTRGWPMPGLYVYAERSGKLQLAGMWQFGGQASVEVLSFAAFEVAHRKGFRFEIGSVLPTTVSFDGESSVPATMQHRTSVFCSGPGFTCVPVISSCDVLVDGKAYYTFRGTVKIEGGMAAVSGDRSRAGPCDQAERLPLAIF